MSSGLRNCSKIPKNNDIPTSTATATTSKTSSAPHSAVDIASVANEPKRRGRKPASHRSASNTLIIKESVVNDAENDTKSEKAERGETVITAVNIKSDNHEEHGQTAGCKSIAATSSRMTISASNVRNASELMKVLDDVPQPLVSTTAMVKSDRSVLLTSTDSGIDSYADVEQELKDVTTLHDDEEASPSERCSDVVAAPQSRNSSVQYDRIVCGDCHAEFSLSTFVEFVEHKISRCDGKQTPLDELLADISPTHPSSDTLRPGRRRRLVRYHSSTELNDSCPRCVPSSSSNDHNVSLISTFNESQRKHNNTIDATTDTDTLGNYANTLLSSAFYLCSILMNYNIMQIFFCI
ncbi:unnamed protein product [Thelazia callipaeda]|uniref:C2H2-type domain-containing protein n=1 Tax=Thelazia callipaeda TaxID=103827 RepID=A0A0N5D019_THECL|nr:unnamed protein product [Thelazia callipaeda]